MRQLQSGTSQPLQLVSDHRAIGGLIGPDEQTENVGNRLYWALAALHQDPGRRAVVPLAAEVFRRLRRLTSRLMEYRIRDVSTTPLTTPTPRRRWLQFSLRTLLVLFGSSVF